MLRITVARIRVFFAVLGCAVLGASLVDWAQTLRATESGFAWVKIGSPITPAVETAEIWQASASCMRPFFVNAVVRSKARLKGYYDLVPDEVRAWRTRPVWAETPQRPDAENGTYRLVSDQQDARGRNARQQERGAMLHARYAEWYANVFKLEIEEHQWEQRLDNVADQSVTVSEATRKSFTAGHEVERGNAKTDFDQYLLGLLGLGGFPSDQEQALRAHCVNIVPVKKVFKSANYLGELWRWPVDHAAAFSFGLELVLIALFFVPIDLWIGTGDAQAVTQYFDEVADRVATTILSYGRKFVSGLLDILFRVLRAIAVGTRAVFTAGINPGVTVGQVHFVSKLAEVRLPQIADNRMLGQTIEWLKRTERAEPILLKISHRFAENID